MTIRIVLSEIDFRTLVGGAMVAGSLPDGREYQIILSDIGYQRMLRALSDAMGGPIARTNAAERGDV